ncbi:MAG: adenylate/guanylate cyclase domain-containing protein [Rhodospirillales bacterium]|nr:adenylate/guanylate cyclase domain-containing protein [Rhodospirillales bacterium]MDH3911062.1 adenylate/guanylate cyclase domain-containing protein [Rhodospirillales bacterium]
MVRRLRLVSGLVLFVFVLTHFLNHALGLVSLEVLEAGRLWFLAFWRAPLVTLMLYGALLLHLALAFWALYRRRRLAMPALEATQLLTGLAIPPLVILHLLGTRFAAEVLGTQDSYTYILLIFGKFKPLVPFRQLAVMTFAWTHGCIGLHYWLRFRPWYPRIRLMAFAAALLVPVLALLGAFVAGRDVLRLAEDPAWLEAVVARLNFADAEALLLIGRLENGFLVGFFALLGLVLCLRVLRDWRARRRGAAYLTYPGGRRIALLPGTTVLEASRGAGIPHASVCGGRGRCSTCRVRVGRGLDALPPPGEAEARVLARVGAAPDVRLACQTRPHADAEVTPLLTPSADPAQAGPRAGYLKGDEREVAVLFADLRGFTALSEDKLPYDIVFLLNRYFAAMGTAVEEAGGRIDKFIGDGVMALFGIERGVGQGCRNALEAARRMAERLAELNAALESELARPLRIGIGIHAGPVIVGEMGYGRATALTAIGDVVNTASRLEALTKELDVQLVLSAPVAAHAGLDPAAFPRREIALRGRSGALAVHMVVDARALSPASAPAAAAVEAG